MLLRLLVVLLAGYSNIWVSKVPSTSGCDLSVDLSRLHYLSHNHTINQADKGKKFNRGGNVANLKKLFKGKDNKSEELKEAKAIKSGKITPEQYAKGEAMEKKMKKGGKCYAGGGAVKSDELRNADIQREMANQTRAVKKATGGCTKMAKGGVTRADGCVTKGHTKGKFV